MHTIIGKILQTGVATTSYPQQIVTVPARFRGMPQVNSAATADWSAAVDMCPTRALALQRTDDKTTAKIKPSRAFEPVTALRLDVGACIFCGRCAEAAPAGIQMSRHFELATRRRESLQKSVVVQVRTKIDHPTATTSASSPPRDLSTIGMRTPSPLRLLMNVWTRGGARFQRQIGRRSGDGEDLAPIGDILRAKIKQMFGRSLHIREVSAGCCNACDLEVQALNNPIFDASRFGMSFVASPRHADMLLVTGVVSRNMEEALLRTYNAMPDPRLVVAVGACGYDGGLFKDSYAIAGGVAAVIPVNAYIPGCPPRPQALLHGILLALERAQEKLPAFTTAPV